MLMRANAHQSSSWIFNMRKLGHSTSTHSCLKRPDFASHQTAFPKSAAEISAVPWDGHNLFHGPSFPAHVGVRRSPWHPCVVTKHWSGPKRPGTERTRRRWRPRRRHLARRFTANEARRFSSNVTRLTKMQRARARWHRAALNLHACGGRPTCGSRDAPRSWAAWTAQRMWG